jgi:anti-sigma B factor antagonist
MGAGMEIKKKRKNGIMVISVTGRLDAVSSPEFENELTGLMAGGERLLVLDFGELDYISSAGLRTILAATKKLKESQGKLTLAALKSVVKEVFEISGFSSIIPIFDSVDSAREDMA